MRVLVTGFAPFGGHAVNPSTAVALALDGLVRDGVTFVARAPLPVRYAEAAAVALDAARALEAEAIIALGLAAGTSHVRIEQRARNRASASEPDAAGRVCAAEEAEPGGPESLATALDTDTVVRALEACGLACAPSDDAGGYVCNDLYYRLLSASARGDGPAHVLFVHIPSNADQLTALPDALATAIVGALQPAT
jgi:pyroglutamyl-peptidase